MAKGAWLQSGQLPATVIQVRRPIIIKENGIKKTRRLLDGEEGYGHAGFYTGRGD